jgi:hypothetical protein
MVDQYSPVEPFGGTNDYAVSEEYIVYTAKDPDLPEAWHTKQNVRTLNPVSELAYQPNFTGIPRRLRRQTKATRAYLRQARCDS